MYLSIQPPPSRLSIHLQAIFLRAPTAAGGSILIVRQHIGDHCLSVLENSQKPSQRWITDESIWKLPKTPETTNLSRAAVKPLEPEQGLSYLHFKVLCRMWWQTNLESSVGCYCWVWTITSCNPLWAFPPLHFTRRSKDERCFQENASADKKQKN